MMNWCDFECETDREPTYEHVCVCVGSNSHGTLPQPSAALQVRLGGAIPDRAADRCRSYSCTRGVATGSHVAMVEVKPPVRCGFRVDRASRRDQHQVLAAATLLRIDTCAGVRSSRAPHPLGSPCRVQDYRGAKAEEY